MIMSFEIYLNFYIGSKSISIDRNAWNSNKVRQILFIKCFYLKIRLSKKKLIQNEQITLLLKIMNKHW